MGKPDRNSPRLVRRIAMTTIFGLRQDYFLSQFGEDKRYAVVSDEEMANPDFMIDAIGDVRLKILDSPDRKCTDHYIDKHRDLDGYFVNLDGTEFQFGDELAETNRYFWRDTIQTSQPRKTALRIRKENREAIREILSVERADNPAKTALWGVRPANDQ